MLPRSRRAIFRKAALERLSAPQELDALIEVTQPRGWLAFAAVALVVGVVLVWAFATRVPVEIQAWGIFVRGQVFHITALQDGQLNDVRIGGQAAVQAGRVVATLRPTSGSGRENGLVDIVAPRAGHLLEMSVKPGDAVTAGRSIATLELNGELEAIVYVRPIDARHLAPKMSVWMLPNGFDESEFGYVIGEVRSVDDVAASREAMRDVLENDQLVDRLAGAGVVTAVHVAIRPDAQTPSGVVWSASAGPRVPIHSGTICSAIVTVDERRPITLLLPDLQVWLGR